jgi:hypothetical protein
MKKFRMMLPVVAFMLAIGAAVAGEFMPPINAYYKIGASCSTTTLPTEQTSCQTNLPVSRPLCTVNVSGTHPQAFNDPACLVPLRYIP